MTDALRPSVAGGSARPEARIDRPVLGTSVGTQARAARPSSPARHRIPSLQELASLVVNGVLRLPARYFRGMFLDITV
jgi:hypothetical protein